MLPLSVADASVGDNGCDDDGGVSFVRPPHVAAELIEDATAIADEYRADGWDAVVLEPVSVFPSERDERFGLAVQVSPTEYGLLETLIENDDVTFDQAEVYYRSAENADDDRGIS